MTTTRARLPFLAYVLTLTAVGPAAAQDTPWTPLKRGSDNIEVLGHLPLGPRLSVADMDVEQELDRPFAYVARMVYGFEGPKGLDIISVADPEMSVSKTHVRVEYRDGQLVVTDTSLVASLAVAMSTKPSPSRSAQAAALGR